MYGPLTRLVRPTLVVVLVGVCCLAVGIGPGAVAGDPLVATVSTGDSPAGMALTDDPLAEQLIDSPPAGSTARPAGSITRCFTGDGYPLAIGNGSAQIDAAVHASVLTDPTVGNEVGVELAGSLERARIVTLAAGVRLDAPGLLAAGANPFAAFDLLYTYELRLPMFASALETSTYQGDDPPVGSAAGTAPC